MNILTRCAAWARTQGGRRVITAKVIISGSVVAIFISPAYGQAISAAGSLFWVWHDSMRA